jgi:hypothetical protein
VRIAVELLFLGVLAEEKSVNRPTLGSRKKDSSSVGMTNKVEIMKILNLRRFENGED